jgi:regulator of sigma E protease
MEMIYGYLHQGLSAIVPFVVLLGLLIFVHELGHFLVAKYFGVRVEVFSLGFGKKIFQFKRGDTVYCLSLIPLGGYVKMFGDEQGVELPEAEKKYSFLHKPVGQRIGVVLAGPLMNFFFAILIFFVVALLGEDLRAPVVGDVSGDSVAYQAGFRSGDTILKAGAKTVRSWDEVQDRLTAAEGSEIQVDIRREVGGQTETLRAKTLLKDNPNILSAESHVGEIPGLSTASKQSVVGIVPLSFADKNGLKTGDRIVMINGHPIKYFREIENVMISQAGEAISLDIERYDFEETKVEKIKINLPYSRFSSLEGLGIESSELYLAKVVEGTPAAQAGLQNGDRVVRVNGSTPEKWEDVLATVKSFSGEGKLSFDINRAGTTKTFEIAPQMTSQMNSQGGEEKRYTIGIIPHIMIAAPVVAKIKASGPIEALQRGVRKTVDVTVMTVLSFVRLVQNKISPKNIGGVISIGQAASETFKIGISHFLQMMAVISINLFILNLLPIPVLDGGHLLFYSIEALRGSPIGLRKMEIAQQMGLVVLVSLMVFALFNDFSRLLGTW